MRLDFKSEVIMKLNKSKFVVKEIKKSEQIWICSDLVCDENDRVYMLAMDIEENSAKRCVIYQVDENQGITPLVTMPIDIVPTDRSKKKLYFFNDVFIVGTRLIFANKLWGYSTSGEMLWQLDVDGDVWDICDDGDNLIVDIKVRNQGDKIMSISTNGCVNWEMVVGKICSPIQISKQAIFFSESESISVYNFEKNKIASIPISAGMPPLCKHRRCKNNELTQIPVVDNTKIVALSDEGAVISEIEFPYMGINLILNAVSDDIIYAISCFDTIYKIDVKNKCILKKMKLKGKTMLPIYEYGDNLVVCYAKEKKTELCILDYNLKPIKQITVRGEIGDLLIDSKNNIYFFVIINGTSEVWFLKKS